jgi:hypothetical protein
MEFTKLLHVYLRNEEDLDICQISTDYVDKCTAENCGEREMVACKTLLFVSAFANSVIYHCKFGKRIPNRRYNAQFV